MNGLALIAATAAWAGQMPEHIDLNDLDRYHDALRDTLRGPGGCWTVEARRTAASWDDGPASNGADILQLGFEGRTWSGWAWDFGFRPLVGKSHGSDGMRALGPWLDRLTTEVELAWLEWDPDRDLVVLQQRVGVQGARGESTRLARFADGGLRHVDLTFPKTQLAPGLKLVGAGYEITFGSHGDQVVPLTELVVYRFRVDGRVVRGHQRTEWTWSRCAG